MKKLLILGAGDVARRALPLLHDFIIDAPTRAEFDLDAPLFERLLRDADALLYTVPPPNVGGVDVRMARLLAFWREHGGAPQHLVYISTSGVYGDCAGDWVDESRALAPQSPRALRRVDAEAQLRTFAAVMGASLSILRAPGIYAAERLPLQRIRDGVPILHAVEDAFSNHVHADDLAAMCVAALRQPCGIEAYNACDDVPIKMGDWFCALAQYAALPLPPRVSRAELEAQVSAMQWSFVRESRRLSNHKIKRDLGVQLRYSSVLDFLVFLTHK